MFQVFKTKGKGRGVKAVRRIAEGTVIEECHVALFDAPEGRKHPMTAYAFRWNKKQVALLLGAGSLYNHSYAPNAVTVPDKRNKTVSIIAYRTIQKGEEILIDYSGGTGCKLWFKVK